MNENRTEETECPESTGLKRGWISKKIKPQKNAPKVTKLRQY